MSIFGGVTKTRGDKNQGAELIIIRSQQDSLVYWPFPVTIQFVYEKNKWSGGAGDLRSLALQASVGGTSGGDYSIRPQKRARIRQGYVPNPAAMSSRTRPPFTATRSKTCLFDGDFGQ